MLTYDIPHCFHYRLLRHPSPQVIQQVQDWIGPFPRRLLRNASYLSLSKHWTCQMHGSFASLMDVLIGYEDAGHDAAAQLGYSAAQQGAKIPNFI